MEISNAKGVTLIEALVVVVILGIAAAIAATTGLKEGTNRTTLVAETNQLISDLRLLQSKASAQQTNLTFKINEDNTGYTMTSFDDPVNLSKGKITAISPTPSSFSFKADGTRDGTGDYEIKLSVNGEDKIVTISPQGLVQLKN